MGAGLYVKWISRSSSVKQVCAPLFELQGDDAKEIFNTSGKSFVIVRETHFEISELKVSYGFEKDLKGRRTRVGVKVLKKSERPFNGRVKSFQAWKKKRGSGLIIFTTTDTGHMYIMSSKRNLNDLDQLSLTNSLELRLGSCGFCPRSLGHIIAIDPGERAVAVMSLFGDVRIWKWIPSSGSMISLENPVSFNIGSRIWSAVFVQFPQEVNDRIVLCLLSTRYSIISTFFNNFKKRSKSVFIEVYQMSAYDMYFRMELVSSMNINSKFHEGCELYLKLISLDRPNSLIAVTSSQVYHIQVNNGTIRVYETLNLFNPNEKNSSIVTASQAVNIKSESVNESIVLIATRNDEIYSISLSEYKDIPYASSLITSPIKAPHTIEIIPCSRYILKQNNALFALILFGENGAGAVILVPKDPLISEPQVDLIHGSTPQVSNPECDVIYDETIKKNTVILPYVLGRNKVLCKRSGTISLDVIGKIELSQPIMNMWHIKNISAENGDILVTSFLRDTKIYDPQSKMMDITNLTHVKAFWRTICAEKSSLVDSGWIQVIQCGLYLIDHNISPVRKEWTCENINLAAISHDIIVLAVWSAKDVFLNILIEDHGGFKLLQSCRMESAICALKVFSTSCLKSASARPMCLVGTPKTVEIYSINRIFPLKKINTIDLQTESIPNSLLALTSLKCADIYIGYRNGFVDVYRVSTLNFQILRVQTERLGNMKIRRFRTYKIGNEPVKLGHVTCSILSAFSGNRLFHVGPEDKIKNIQIPPDCNITSAVCLKAEGGSYQYLVSTASSKIKPSFEIVYSIFEDTESDSIFTLTHTKDDVISSLYDSNTSRLIYATSGTIDSLIVSEASRGSPDFLKEMDSRERILKLKFWNITPGKRFICVCTEKTNSLDKYKGRIIVSMLKKYPKEDRYGLKLLSFYSTSNDIIDMCSFELGYAILATSSGIDLLKISSNYKDLLKLKFNNSLESLREKHLPGKPHRIDTYKFYLAVMYRLGDISIYKYDEFQKDFNYFTKISPDNGFFTSMKFVNDDLILISDIRGNIIGYKIGGAKNSDLIMTFIYNVGSPLYGFSVKSRNSTLPVNSTNNPYEHGNPFHDPDTILYSVTATGAILAITLLDKTNSANYLILQQIICSIKDDLPKVLNSYIEKISQCGNEDIYLIDGDFIAHLSQIHEDKFKLIADKWSALAPYKCKKHGDSSKKVLKCFIKNLEMKL